MKFVGHKKLKKQQLGHGAFGDTITVMTSYLQGGGGGRAFTFSNAPGCPTALRKTSTEPESYLP